MSLRNRKRTLAAAGASLALAATLVGVGLTTQPTVASAAPSIEQLMQAQQPSPSPQPGQPGPGQRGPRQFVPNMQDRQQMQQAFQAALAGHLGISADQLAAAQKQARIDVINQMVAAGKITQDQANQRIQAIQSGQRPGFQNGQGRPGMGPGMMRPGGPGAVAGILGMTPDQLRAEFQAGKSLAQIGQEHGLSRDQLKQKLLDAEQAQLNAAVQAGRLTADQAQQIQSRRAANIDRILDMTPGQRQPGQQAPASGN